MDRLALVAKLEQLFAANEEFAAVYLFGSVARGEDGPQSDIDIAVLYPQATPHTLLDAPFALEANLNDQLHRRVQIVVLNTAPVDLVQRVLRDGILLAEKDPSRRVRFIVDARNRYWDMRPILDEYRGAKR
ncbi:MAG: nucleotidyltransferase domain-containing protein [Leptospirales bacterium]|nr:nucleotidyltransferase domain-containing protein [Leptospirales bacterium]